MSDILRHLRLHSRKRRRRPYIDRSNQQLARLQDLS
jgi:hypothetical protein